MNIGIVSNWFPAGAGYVSRAYHDVFQSQGHNVFIYARGGHYKRGNKDWDGSKVTWAPLWNGKIICKHLIQWTKERNIEFLLFNEQRYWKPVIEVKKEGVLIGAYIDYYKQNTVPAFSVYDCLICNTRRHYSVFDWHHGSLYIPWGTDVEKYSPNPQNRPVTFLISSGWQLGKNSDRRGSLLALQAFLCSTGDATLLFYSQTSFDDIPEDVKTKINSDSRIKFIEGTFDPFPYSEGDVYLYPSRLDGIGLTVPEALSSGLSVITTDCAPMNEFVVNEYNGKTVSVEKYLGRHDGYYWAESIVNNSLLARSIQEYIDDPSILKIHKKNAREFSVENLNWKKNSKDIVKKVTDACKFKGSLGIDDATIRLCEKLDATSNPGIIDHLKKAMIYLKNNLKESKKYLLNYD